MGRKLRRSNTQIKQTENITLRRTQSRPNPLRVALAETKTETWKINRLAKKAQIDLRQEIRNGRKRELRMAGKVDAGPAEVENLQAQVVELTATVEAGERGAARVVEVWEGRNKEMKVRRFREQVSRIPSRLERAIQTARGTHPAGTATHRIKSAAGVVEDWARDLIRSLVIKVGVPVVKVPAAFLLVAQALGIDVEDTVSDRTCRRIVLEGGVLAKAWLAKEIPESTSLTISGDATTLRGISYESRHATLLLPVPSDDDSSTGDGAGTDGASEKTSDSQRRSVHSTGEGEDHTEASLNVAEQRGAQINGSGVATPSLFPLKPVIRTFGTWSTVDHKSETQVQGWKEIVGDIFSTFKRSPMGSSSSVGPREFAQKVTGICSDHAADQKKLARLVGEWKQNSDRELRGEKEMLLRGELEIIREVAKAWNEVLAEVGGLGSWEQLSKERQDELLESVVRRVRVMFGGEAYEKLTPAEKRRADLFIWTGCAMHKDLNSTKGGAEAMAASWGEGEASVKLMNKYNVVAAAAGSIELGKRAADDSEGGAVKLTKLVGFSEPSSVSAQFSSDRLSSRQH